MAPVRRTATALPAKPSAASRKEALAANLATASVMWAAGSSQAVIAKHFGVTRNTVAGWQARNRHLFALRVAAPEAEPAAAEIPLPAETSSAVGEDLAPADAPAAVPVGEAEAGELPAHMAQASLLWRQGSTGREIAAALGVTKSAVAGWAGRHREHFPVRDPSAVALAHHARRRVAKDPALAAEERPKPAKKARAAAEKPATVPPAADAEPVAASPVDAEPAAEPIASDQPSEAAPTASADERPARAGAFRPLRGFDPVALVDAQSSSCRWPVYPAGRSEWAVAIHCCGRATGDVKRSYCDVHARMSTGAGSSAERAAHKMPRLPSGGAVPVFFASEARG